MADLITQFPKSLTMTDAVIYRLPQPTSRVTIRDTRLSQLMLTLGPRSRAWYLIATVQRRTRRVKLGRFPVLGVDDARRRAVDALRKLYAGEDPRTPKEAALTLSKALDKYLEGRKLRDSSAADCRGVIERHAARWLDKPLATLTPEAVAARYREVSAKSISMANKLLRNLSAVARHSAIAYGAGDPDVVKKARVLLGGVESLAPRDNLIPDALQKLWFEAVDKLPDQVRRLVLALALTGCRKDELRAARGEAWDCTARVLRIAETKSGKPHNLPAGGYLTALLGASTGSRLFTVGEHELRSAYEHVAAAIGHAWTPHDLRRGFATTAARLGFEELTIKRLLNHAAQGVTQTHYIRLSVDDLKAPMQAIENQLVRLWGVEAAGVAA